MIAMTSAPRLYCESSEASGRFTLMTMSASFTASAATVAPTAVKSESNRPDLRPAPGSIATSTPSALNFFTVSGEAATRGSAGSISLATAIFMRPPESARRTSIELAPALRSAIFEIGSDEEVGHQDEDDCNRHRAVFHQLDETLIGRFMGRIVHAVGGRVGYFAMFRYCCHCCPQLVFDCGEELPQSRGQGNGAAPIGSFGGPIVPYPAGEAVFIDLSSRQRKDHRGRIGFRHIEIDAVHTQEGVERQQRRSLVAID